MSYEEDLVTAVRIGNYKTVRWLLRHTDVNLPDPDETHRRLLTFSIHHRPDYNIVEDLIHQGIDVNIPTKDGTTPLMMIISKGDLRLYHILMECGSVIVNSQDNEGNTALHIAAKLDRIDLTRDLLARGADVKIRNRKGETALHIACSERAPNVLKILVESERVELDARDNSQRTPLHLAAMTGQDLKIKLLLKKGAIGNPKDHELCTPLVLAAKGGHLSAVEALLIRVKDVEINSQDNTLSTALHYATKEGHREIVRILLGKGAAEGIKDNKGLIPEEHCKTFKGSKCKKVYKGDHRHPVQALSDIVTGERYNPNKHDIKTGEKVGEKKKDCLVM